jgi:hypothetical protein
MSAATYPSATYSFPVVILGGGFAGAYCARVLSAGLGRNAADAVALVADQNVMLFHPMLAEVSGSSISPLHVVNPLRRFCPGASIFRGAVEEVDRTSLQLQAWWLGRAGIHYIREWLLTIFCRFANSMQPSAKPKLRTFRIGLFDGSRVSESN